MCLITPCTSLPFAALVRTVAQGSSLCSRSPQGKLQSAELRGICPESATEAGWTEDQVCMFPISGCEASQVSPVRGWPVRVVQPGLEKGSLCLGVCVFASGPVSASGFCVVGPEATVAWNK